MAKKHTKQIFIDGVLKKYPQNNDKYDYSLVDYKDSKTCVDIICLLHGIFQQTPDNHLQGRGCPKCAKEKSILCLKLGSKISGKIANKRARIFSDEKTGFYINKTIWNQYKKGALERNLIFEITPEDIFDLYKKQNGLCVYTGAQLNCDNIVCKKIDWSIDRIDNSIGYTKDNILLVSKTANVFRNRSTIKEFLEFCNMVVSVHNATQKYSNMSPEEKAEILKSHSIRFNKKKD
jgi:hypothetical protein